MHLQRVARVCAHLARSAQPHRAASSSGSLRCRSSAAPPPAAPPAAAAAAGGGGSAGAPAASAGAAPPSAAAAASGPGSDVLPGDRLRQLRRDGLALKDKIKIGRLGVDGRVAAQIHRRWNTSEARAEGGRGRACLCPPAHPPTPPPHPTHHPPTPRTPHPHPNPHQVARIRCEDPKQGADMRRVATQLESATGGVVVHRAGGTVLLYRGDRWPRALELPWDRLHGPEPLPPPPQQQQGWSGAGGAAAAQQGGEPPPPPPQQQQQGGEEQQQQQQQGE